MILFVLLILFLIIYWIDSKNKSKLKTKKESQKSSKVKIIEDNIVDSIEVNSLFDQSEDSFFDNTSINE